MNERLKKDLDEMASILDEVKNTRTLISGSFTASSYLKYT